MATITIENVPEDIIQTYGTKINFDYNISFTKENNQIQWTDYEEKAFLKWKKDFVEWNIIDGESFFNSIISKNV